MKFDAIEFEIGRDKKFIFNSTEKKKKKKKISSMNDKENDKH